MSLLFLQLTPRFYSRTFVRALLSVRDAPLQDVPVACSHTSAIGPFLATLFKLTKPTIKLPAPTHAPSTPVLLPCVTVLWSVDHPPNCIFYAAYLGTNWGTKSVLPRNALGSRWWIRQGWKGR